MESRNFKLDTEWNMVHYPAKPNGFGILIIGDERHFVDGKSSFWIQNEGKLVFINKLRDAGYTIFYSNLYGRNWGSEKAVTLVKHLCHHILKNEILNYKIHIIAEGMGALTAFQLVNDPDLHIRSMLLVNPVLSLKKHLEHEKEHKFFYKKILKELGDAFREDGRELEEVLAGSPAGPELNPQIPVKVIQVLAGNRSYKQSEYLRYLSRRWEQQKLPVSLSYVVPEKKQQLGSQAIRFFNSHEHIL
ncbi:hydrolase [Bacillus sp. T33-2]|uniref:hydrolase n=1 Tax=Bacillus sp. T33-2 TaxID=2054168 RepID=UPI000C784606|nr:hydrolase [Bacillus sp. T33-2]PLR97623.1 hydrolase [Bacillus sp. T33-2]